MSAEILEQIRKATMKAQVEDDLPDFLADAIFPICDQPQSYEHFTLPLMELLMQVSDFNLYSEAGCCKTDYSAEDIKIYSKPFGSRVLYWLKGASTSLALPCDIRKPKCL